MIVEFQVSNFGSYRDPTSLNMQSSREQHFRERVPRLRSGYRMSVNPIAAIYGANASGKSTLFYALAALETTILGSTPTDWQYDNAFALDPEMRSEPTLFKLVFILNEKMYTYFLAIEDNSVVEEYLSQINTNKKESLLFERSFEHITFGEDHEGDNLLVELGKTTPGNVALAARLANILRENEHYTDLCSVFFFFQKLVWISPLSDHLIIPKFYQNFDLSAALQALDTGVTRLDIKYLPEEEWPFKRSDITQSSTQMRVKDGKLYLIEPNDEKSLELSHVRLCHQDADGNEYLLNWHQESQGTRKILVLLPWLWVAANADNPPILLVDELDHSLHTQLAKVLIQVFLSSCTQDTRAQLIFTAHDLLLMDLDYLRRDEIWITDKNLNGESQLIGLPEYKGIRADKDIRKSYLQGRFGGVPQLEEFTLKEARSA